jgi:hypothetical protein
MPESKSTIAIYASDLSKINVFYESHKELNSKADALRVAIEYADAHGALK